MKPLIPNTYVLNNKYLQSILSPSTDIIDYNFSSEQIHKLNLLQILRPDVYFNKKLSDDEFYEISRNYYQKLINDNIIYKSEDEYFLYRIDSKDHSQTGLISLLNIQDYLNNNIKPHEKILVSKGKERAEQLSKVKFQLSPIYLFYDDQNIDLNLDIHHEKKPIIKFKSGNYTHSIYKTKTDFSGINFKELYVADGHHRIEGFAQLDVKKDTKFMAIIFPKSKCSNMAYDRSVKFPKEYKIIGTAREINNYKSYWCAEKIQNKKLSFELKYGKKPKTAIMGLAFKPNIDDLRESPAKYIAQKVLQNSNNEDHFIVEPNIYSHSVYKLTDYKEAIKKADIIVFLVAHKEFKKLNIEKNKIVLDFCGIFK